jgi:hypothetical protein
MQFQKSLARGRMRDNDYMEVDLGLTIVKVSNENLIQLTESWEDPPNTG